ncbi:MAG: NAD(P)H-dependent dehydrogenase/reductase [Desulfobulbaceae bacterium]|nr:NAD(P)H-dependent dehydrogenase/reductase [Desulfobulbaceae bacterium]
MFIELLRKRRSIRQYEAKAVESEKVDLLVEAMLRSPSSRSLNPWEFVVIEDKEMIQDLARSKPHGATFMQNAPLAIAVCANPEKCDVWIEDCSIAALNIHLAATDLDLGSCWIQIRMRDYDGETTAEDYVKEKLGLNAEMRVEAIVAIGYGKEDKPGHQLAVLPFDQVSYERFGNRKP